MDGVVIHRIVADDNDGNDKDRSTGTGSHTHSSNDSFLKLIQRVYDDNDKTDSSSPNVPAPVTPPTSAIKMNSCNEEQPEDSLKQDLLRPSNSPDTVISSIVNLTDTPPSTSTSTVTGTTGTTPVIIPIAEMVSVSPSSSPPNNKENVVAHGNIISKQTQQYLPPFGSSLSSSTTAAQPRRKPPLHQHHGKPPSGRPHRRLQSLPAVTNLTSIVATAQEETTTKATTTAPLSMADIASAAMIAEEGEEDDEAGKEHTQTQPQRRFFNRNTGSADTADNNAATTTTGAATTGATTSTAGSDTTSNLQSQQQSQPKQSSGIRPKRSHRRTNSLPVVLEMEDTTAAQEEATTTPTTPTKPKPSEEEQQLNDIAAFAAAALGGGGLVAPDQTTTTRSSVYVVATPSTAVASLTSNSAAVDDSSSSAVLSPTVVEKKKPPPSHQRPPSGAHAHRRYFSTMTSSSTGSGSSLTQHKNNGHPPRGGIPKVYNAPPSDGSEGELPSDDMLQALMGDGGNSFGGSRGGENAATASSQQNQSHARRHSRDLQQQHQHARHASLPALLSNNNRHQRVRSSSNSSNGSSGSSSRSSMMMSPERFERRERERQQLLQQQKQQAMGIPSLKNQHKRCHSNSPAANHAFQSILRNREALKCNSQLIQTIEQLGGNEYHIDVAKLLNQMGWILFTSGNFKDASYFYKRSLKTVHHLQTHSIAQTDDDYYQVQKLEASISTNLGTTQWRLHEFTEALQNFLRSYQIHKATYDHSTSTTTTTEKDSTPHLKALGDACYNVSCAYVFCKDYNAAIDKLKECYKYQTCLSNKQVNMDIARTLSMLGTVYGHKCAWDQSLKYHQKALQVKHDVVKRERQQSSSTPDYAPPTVLSSMKDVAKTLEQLGRHKEALGYYQQLLQEEHKKRLFYMVNTPNQQHQPYQLSQDECIQQGQLWTTVGNLQFLLKYPIEVCYKSLQEGRLLYTKAGLFTTTFASNHHPCVVQWMESFERLQHSAKQQVQQR